MGFGLIVAIIFLKYKPTYEVSLSGENIGYVKSKLEFTERIQTEIIEMEGENIDFVTLKELPNYELKLIDRSEETNEDEILLAMKQDADIMYKCFAVMLNNEVKSYVDNLEEAEQAINEIKDNHKNDKIELDLKIVEHYTENLDELTIESVQVAQAEVEKNVEVLIEEDKKSKMQSINGVIIASTPVIGRVTSRYGVSSTIRSSAHTGTDISAPQGTNIKAVADGTVTFSERNGSYGNLIKISHGNGVETWYAHCSKLYANVGQKVNAGDVIAAVGSTGNSTGPHLHLEIRVNGKTINPQKYLYK